MRPGILLVEDDQDFALLIEQMLQPLRHEGYDILKANYLDSAREALRTWSVNCVVLDLTLPDAQGLELIEEIREIDPDVAIVILSGDEDEKNAMEALQRGAQDYFVKGTVDSNLLVRAIRYAIERKKLEAQLAHQALHDPLTELPNRSLFIDRLSVAISRLGRRESMVGVIFMDLDNFKYINDTLGHDSGDELLIEIAGRLSSMMRLGDTVARLGGDEFCVLCEDLTDRAQAREIANRVSEAFDAPFHIGHRELFVTTSLGVAVTTDPLCSPAAILRDSDAAMYKAKERGRHRTEMFDESIRKELVERMDMEHGLRRALTENEFVLDFQPIIDLQSQRIVCLEALVRWNHPQKGLLAPATFVPIAEETGLIVPLGRWVVHNALTEAAKWQDASGEGSDVQVSINVAPRQVEETDLVADVILAIEDSGIEPRNIILELTESTLMQLSGKATRKLKLLKEIGVRVALDDFGTGYSSLSYLQKFPVDIVKVDKSFVQDIANSPERLAFARAIVTFSSSLNLQTIAEGIELASQADHLKEMNCELGQGFLFAEPMSSDQVVVALNSV